MGFYNVGKIKATDMNSVEYEIKGIMEFGNDTKYLIEHGPKQKLTVANSIRKGQKWCCSESIDNGLDYFDFELTSVENMGKGFKKLSFVRDKNFYNKFSDDLKPKSDAYKELLLNLNLHKDQLAEMINGMLLNVFTAKMLKDILKQDKAEFIVDETMIYLKSGNKAYRV